MAAFLPVAARAACVEPSAPALTPVLCLFDSLAYPYPKMPIMIPMASVRSHSLGMRAIGWFDDRYPVHYSWPSVAGKEAQQLREGLKALDAPPAIGSYNHAGGAPSMPCAPLRHGVRWPFPSGGDANPQSGRPDAFWPGSTGTEVGPGTYSVTHVHPFNMTR